MRPIDPETFEIKYEIAQAATDLYIEGGGAFTMKDIAGRLNLTVSDIFEYFPNKRAILQFYYASLIFRYEMMIDEIDSFDSYSLSEKLSNFVYSSFDMLQEKKAFVKATFGKLILQSFTRTDFEKETERLIKQFLSNDPRLSASSAFALNQCFYGFLRYQYLQLINFWLEDESEGNELSMELTDKLTTFLEELMYNAILDKSFDVVKFLVNNKKAFFSRIPIIKQILSKVEIR